MSQIFFAGSLSKITLTRNVQFGREKINSPAKFCLLGSKILLLEVTNRSHPYISLIKDYMAARIIGIITARQAFKTMMKIFTTTMGKLRVTAVLEIVLNCCMTVAVATPIYNIELGTSIDKI